MYLYGFTTFAGIDKIMKLDRDDLGFSVGDLLKSDDEYFLVLGDTISFAEQYNYQFPKGRNLKLFYKKFFSKKHIDWIHWMVDKYYSPYKNVMRYFIDQDIETLFKKEEKKKSKIQSIQSLKSDSFGVDSFSDSGQTLIVYPDFWTMNMMVNDDVKNESGVLFLHSLATQSKKNKAFWQVKQGLVKYILVTHAQLFHDFKDLQSIILVHPYKWYYANQQDPRYKTPEVLSYLADIWKIKLLEVH